jgi:hypothetical protein
MEDQVVVEIKGRGNAQLLSYMRLSVKSSVPLLRGPTCGIGLKRMVDGKSWQQ